MKATIGRSIKNPNNFHITNVTKTTPFFIQSSSSSSPFSTSSAGGRGRGRGRGAGGGPNPFDFTPTPGNKSDSKPDSTDSPPSSLGHGRGKPIVSDPILPSFSSFVSSIKPGQTGTGRGRVTPESEPSQPRTESKKPIFVQIQELSEVTAESSTESNLPSSILSVLPGAGRGKPTKQPGPTPKIKEENRHVRARPRAGAEPGKRTGPAAGPEKPKLSREEAVKNAMKMLSHGEGGEEGGGRGRGRGRGGRGRGRGGRGMQRGERRGRRGEDSEEGSGLYLGDNADGEKLAEKLGVENMNKLVEGFDEMSRNVLPSPMEDAYVDALHTNYAVRVW